MTLVSVTAYHLYGTISVNTIFSRFFAPMVGLRLGADRSSQTTALQSSAVGSNTVRGELAIQRGSSRRILVFGRSQGTQTMMQ